MKHLKPEDFVNFNDNHDGVPMRIELAYARHDNQLFGEPIYKPDAKLWVHKDLAGITLRAAKDVHKSHNLTMVVYDCLRTSTAQEKMMHTARVENNPHWLEEPRLLSPAGAGAHPRGMAIDVSLQDENGTLLDMGTPFDFLAEDSSPEINPAHRNYIHLPETVRQNRKILDDAMMNAAKSLGHHLVLLPQEWWDFRFGEDVYEQYAPLSDDDLPTEMRCCG